MLAVHGGLGIPQKQMTPEIEKRYRQNLVDALKSGYQIHQKGGRSLDMVEAAVKVLEDAPEFNAGRGSVFTHDGRNELDAAIMSGRDLSAGAVAEVTTVKNPISLARLVMERSVHVFLVGLGAEQFAAEMGVTPVAPSYFRTDERYQEWKQVLADSGRPVPPHHHWGTVGAVGLDSQGDLSAATSTGGITDKLYGRVGDTPIIGAGTYAENGVAAISCTGHGEYFIRYAVAHDIIALMKYRGLSVEAAAEEVIFRKLKPVGGEGGTIVLDSHGNVAMAFHSEGMTRGFVTETGEIQTFLYTK